MQTVKYPYTNLKKHHGYYLSLVESFFKSTFDVWFHVGLKENCISIKIHEVNPHKLYNPMNFDPSYKVRRRDQNIYGYEYLNIHDLFDTFYKYIPDIVPYLEIELFVAHDFMYGSFGIDESKIRYDGCFETINFREQYYMEECRRYLY